MSRIAWIATAYVAGTLPSPYLIARLIRRRDLIASMRREESPSDAHFVLAKQGSAVLGGIAIVLDIIKGFVPALIARLSDADAVTLAWMGVAAVAGHSFAPFLRKVGGRGLTTAAGVSLVIVPKAMVGSGLIALAGTVTKRGGFGTSIGFGLLPVFAALFGYERALLWMTVGIVALIGLRRLEGLSGDREAGVPLGRAILGRLLFDSPRGGGSVHPEGDPAS